MKKFDLHMHSYYSRDGEFSPKEIIQKAKEKDLKVIALSDHNEMRGIDEMIQYGKKENILVIPAIEFDTTFEDLDVHLLGYNINYNLPYFKEIGEEVIKAMDIVLHERILKFQDEYNIVLDEEALLGNVDPAVNPFFNIVSTMLNDNKDIPAFKEYLEGGSRSDPQVVNFYWDVCCKGAPCYVPVKYPDFNKTVSLIHQSGGIAILAHPWKQFYKKEALLEKAIQAGIDGIECYSNYHEKHHNEYYEKYCEEHNLLITCGSDFHGALKPSINLGEYGYHKTNSEQILEAFLNKINQKVVE